MTIPLPAKRNVDYCNRFFMSLWQHSGLLLWSCVKSPLKSVKPWFCLLMLLEINARSLIFFHILSCYWLFTFTVTSIITSTTRNDLSCADVPLRNYLLTVLSAKLIQLPISKTYTPARTWLILIWVMFYASFTSAIRSSYWQIALSISREWLISFIHVVFSYKVPHQRF